MTPAWGQDTDPDRVAAALEADWLVAVGLRDGDASATIESYLRDAIANGNFVLLEQETPSQAADQQPASLPVVPHLYEVHRAGGRHGVQHG